MSFRIDYLFTLECRHEGALYEAGSRFPVGDGCNECICTTLGIPHCTKYACFPGMYPYNAHMYVFLPIINHISIRLSSLCTVKFRSVFTDDHIFF